MNDNNRNASDALWGELAGYISSADKGFGDIALTALDDLLTYLDDTYPDDEAIQVLAQRAWQAAAHSPVALYSVAPSKPGILKSELARTERWALYLEGKDDPNALFARHLWNALSACFNPATEELEEYYVGDEAQTLAELQAKHGAAPEGEPPAIFN